MKDVRLLIQDALEPLCIPVDAERHELANDDIEYIVYFVESERGGHYADNKPHLRRSSVSLYYITKSLNNKLTRPDEIISAMETQGFKVAERQIDLTNNGRQDNLLATGWTGIRQEYLIERWF